MATAGEEPLVGVGDRGALVVATAFTCCSGGQPTARREILGFGNCHGRRLADDNLAEAAAAAKKALCSGRSLCRPWGEEENCTARSKSIKAA